MRSASIAQLFDPGTDQLALKLEDRHLAQIGNMIDPEHRKSIKGRRVLQKRVACQQPSGYWDLVPCHWRAGTCDDRRENHDFQERSLGQSGLTKSRERLRGIVGTALDAQLFQPAA